jgi:Na+/H+ antiporter NhaD/arsenite permease-like protein
MRNWLDCVPRARLATIALAAVVAAVAPLPAMAAAPGGEAPGLIWGLPFLGVLLSIALLPMLAERLWHKRMGVVAAIWVLALLIPQTLVYGIGVPAHGLWHAILLEYLPFVTLLLALFTAGGGILVRGGPAGSPFGNTVLIAVGMVLAGIMGTTGAAMVLIHPLLRANAHRTRKVHLVIFFIILVANAGGATTPLGDPPLYLGFLQGVPFFWPATHLILLLAVIAVVLLPLFYIVDRIMAAKDGTAMPPREPLRVRGWPNVVLVLVVAGTVLGQGIWTPGDVVLWGQAIGIERLVGMAIFLVVTVISYVITPLAVREGNMFNWHPMEEVGKLFFAIFATIGPVILMLQAGFDGPLAALLHLTIDANGHPLPIAYFWLTGILSAFLDNAPTYLVFFELAGGDVPTLTGRLELILEAISAGAVFFGALTYIGNAPNLMVRSIAAHRGVRMPGFFGFLAWTCVLLLPVFVLLTVLFFLKSIGS